jgi:hypothetical protein
MQSTFKTEREIRAIRAWIVFFMVALAVSGLTAIPAEWGLSILVKLAPIDSAIGLYLDEVYRAVRETGSKYPFLFYGYDWLAFAHLVLALLFIGPYKSPVRNKWVIEFAIYACILVIPFALIAGYFRHIPFWWRLIDCSFGVFGLIPLILCYKRIYRLESLLTKNHDL